MLYTSIWSLRNTIEALLSCIHCVPSHQNCTTWYITHNGLSGENTSASCIFLKYHYSLQSCRCGPLPRFWCMHYESEHSYFKDLAHRVRCFKNIPRTLSYHHQRLQCLEANSCWDTIYSFFPIVVVHLQFPWYLGCSNTTNSPWQSTSQDFV